MSLKEGDIVQVIHMCCDKHLLGMVDAVSATWFAPRWICLAGNHLRQNGILLARLPGISSEPSNPMNGWFPQEWLKKLEPPSEDELVRTDTEVTA